MASRKTWEMAFALTASLGNGYTATFSRAQETLKSLANDIREVNRQQSDITAYNRLTESIRNTTDKFNNLSQQYTLINQQIEETKGSTTALQREKLKLQQRLNDTARSLQNQIDKLEMTRASMEAAGIDTSDLAGESARLKSELESLQRQQEEVAQGATDMGDQSVAAFDAISSAIVSAGLMDKLKDITVAFAECVSVAGELEYTMSAVEAISGANTEQLGDLTSMAREMGVTTKFSANEAATAMTYMAMAGWSAEEMIQGMPGVIALAEAGGEDLAETSSIMADNLTAFGMAASDAGHFADVMATAATNSNTDVSLMGTTFKSSAAVAGALGYSIEDVAVAIGLMANNGVKGTRAGTTLRNIFTGLLEGVTLTGQAFGEYEFTATKADGTMKSFADTMNELRMVFDQMTGIERTANAEEIAGLRGFTGLLAILNATEEDYRGLTDAINESAGAAQSMADIKMDNFVGQGIILRNEWEAVKTSLGDIFLPMLTDLEEKAQGVLSWVNEFIQENPVLVKAITAFISVIGIATAAVAAYNAVVKIGQALNVGALFTGLPGIILGGVAAVASLTAAFVALTDAAGSLAEEEWTLTEASRAQYEQLQDLSDQYDNAVEQYGENSQQALYLEHRIEELNSAYEASKQTLEEYSSEMDAWASDASSMLDADRSLYEQVERDEGTTLGMIARLQELAGAETMTAAASEEIKAIIKDLNSEFPDMAIAYEDVISGATDYAKAIEDYAEKQYEAQKYEAAQQGVVDAYAKKEEAARKAQEATDAYNKAQERYNEVEAEYVKVLNESGYEAAQSIFRDRLEAAQNELDIYAAAVGEADEVSQQAVADYETYSQALVDYAQETGAAATETEAMMEVISEATTKTQALAAAYEEAYDAARDSISGQYELWDEAAEVEATSVSSIISNLNAQAGYWADYNANLASLNERKVDIEGLGEVIASFADGSTDSVNAIAGMASASDEDLAKMVASWQTVQDEEANASASIAELATNYESEMANIQSTLVTTVGSMNLSGEAAAAGRQTILGFINGSNEYLPAVYSAYVRLARQALQAIDDTMVIQSPSHVMREKANYTWAGFIEGTEDAESDVKSSAGNVMQSMLTAFNAASAGSGSLVDGLGGMVRGGGGGNVSVTFEINGAADASTVAMLQNYGDDFAERVLEVVNGEHADNRRRAFA